MSKEKSKRRIREITAFAAALLMVEAFSLPSGTEIMGVGFGSAVVASAAEIANGKCGTSVNWSLDDAGTLTITGSGNMDNWASNVWVPWYSCIEKIKSVEIGDGVSSIGKNAFCWCENLESITIPNSVSSIGNNAFKFCSSLASITLPSNNSFTTIPEYAFSYCTSLESITIPEGVTTIKQFAFMGCENIASINIPKCVTSIGIGAFNSCSNLTSITVDAENTKFFSESGVLFNKDKTELIRYPANKDGTSYDIPAGVTSIGSTAFEKCYYLESIIIPNSVTTIEQEAFFDCKKLISIVIPNGVSTIYDDAFSYCTSLESIFIPDSVTSIGTDAIPAAVTIVNYTAEDNGNVTITKVTFGEGQTSFDIPKTIGGKTVSANQSPNSPPN